MTSHGVARVQPPKTEQARKRELQKIDEYKTLVARLNAAVSNNEYTAESLQLTSQILTRNPEFYTIWNQRRRILNNLFVNLGDDQAAQVSIQGYLQNDLEFLMPLLMEYPKTYWIWNHRLWVLRQFSRYLGADVAMKAWAQELSLVGKMLARDSRNFHGWSYRRRVIAELEKLGQEVARERPNKPDNDEGEKKGDGAEAVAQQTRSSQSLTESEYAYTTKMIHSNLSNFSAWHSRSKLIPKLLDERHASQSDRRKMFDSEMDLVQQALLDPYNQSIWFYLQFLMAVLLASGTEADQMRPFVQFTNHDRVEYLESQIEMMKELLEDSEDCKWIYQYLLEYAGKYMEIEGGNKLVTTIEIRQWLGKLEQLDPLRKGRWTDVRLKMAL